MKLFPARIFLIGFMGSGKSTLGRQLGEVLNIPFVDLDERVEQAAGMPIADIFRKHGEVYFRHMERECLLQTEAEQPVVVALGGGTPCFFDNMDWIQANGFSVYLRWTPEVLAERLRGQGQSRPLLERLNHEGLLRYIRETLSIREPFYLRADLIADDVVDAQDLLDRIGSMFHFRPD